MTKEEAALKVEAEAKRAEFVTKIIGTSKNVLLIISIAVIIGWVVVKFLFSENKKAKSLLDIITKESDKKIKEKQTNIDESDSKIKKIREERDKKLREIEEADEDDLKDIIKGRKL